MLGIDLCSSILKGTETPQAPDHRICGTHALSLRFISRSWRIRLGASRRKYATAVSGDRRGVQSSRMEEVPHGERAEAGVGGVAGLTRQEPLEW